MENFRYRIFLFIVFDLNLIALFNITMFIKLFSHNKTSLKAFSLTSDMEEIFAMFLQSILPSFKSQILYLDALQDDHIRPEDTNNKS